jgi:hypothetical protein
MTLAEATTKLCAITGVADCINGTACETAGTCGTVCADYLDSATYVDNTATPPIDCLAEYTAQVVCFAGLKGSDFTCNSGTPETSSCATETDAVNTCMGW